MIRELLRRLSFLLHRNRYERELEEEMAHHLAMLEHDRPGPSAARRQFGNVTTLKEESRDMWTFRFLEQTAQDLRYAVRNMAAAPLFTITAALSLALGIGANTAIYSFMNAIMMRSLPVYQPERLAILGWHTTKRSGVVKGINGTMRRYQKTGSISPNFPYRAWENLRSQNDVFDTLIAYTYVRNFNAIVNNQADAVNGGFVSGNYFAGLGVPPAAGRLIGSEDDRSGAASTAVLSYSFWQSRFNADPAAVGRSILLNNQPFTIVGVSAPGFFGVDPQSNPSVFLPIHALPSVSQNPVREERSRFFDDHFYWIEMIGRLRTGVTLAQAEAATRARYNAFAASTAESPKDAEVLPEVSLEPGGSGLDSLREQYAKPLLVLMTMVALILAIACANLANLLLARAAARRREIAVRLSLGAGRWRIVRQMLTESILLAVTGGICGLAVAASAIRLITWLIANGRANFTLRAELDWPVLAFTFALAVVAGVVFGLAPALQATKVDFTPALKEQRTQGSTGTGRVLRLGHVLIAAQIAVSLLLVVGAGLFVRTLSNLHSIDVGFNKENLLLVSLNGRQAGYRGDALARFYGNLTDRFRQIPGVRSASATAYPLASQYSSSFSVTVPGRVKQPGDGANIMTVDPAFLATMQIPILAGRDLDRGDLTAPQVAVVTRKFATTFFGDQNPIGRQFAIGTAPDAPLIQIVGIARASHYNSLKEGEEQATIYLPYTQDLNGLNGLFFVLRTAGPPTSVIASVSRLVHDASPSISITEISTQAERIEQTIAQERTFANLGTGFAVLALVIACVGLYGAMAYTVARRNGEIGIRMALGAQRPLIVWMVLRQVLALTAAGLVIGLIAARFCSKLVASFLYGLKPNDPIALVGATAALLLAGYLPARKASRIDPAVALRNE